MEKQEIQDLVPVPPYRTPEELNLIILQLEAKVHQLEELIPAIRQEADTRIRTMLMAIGESLISAAMPPQRTIRDIVIKRVPDEEAANDSTFGLLRIKDEIFLFMLKDSPDVSNIDALRALSQQTNIPGVTPEFLAGYLHEQQTNSASINIYLYYNE